MKINWGVIGCGGIAFRRTIPGLVLSENSNLVAVMDTNFDAAKTVQKEFDAKYAFDNVEDLLAVDEIDAVYIATPVFCHKDQVMKAAAAKKHILLEKPMGLTLEDSTEIKEFCEKQGVKLGVGLMMRFNNLHEEVRELVRAGKLGEIVSMRAQFTCWYPEMEGAWRQKMALSGGGALMDMGVHCIDLLRFMSGLEAKEIVSLIYFFIIFYKLIKIIKTIIDYFKSSKEILDENLAMARIKQDNSWKKKVKKLFENNNLY